jgi:hypothetical protein
MRRSGPTHRSPLWKRFVVDQRDRHSGKSYRAHRPPANPDCPQILFMTAETVLRTASGFHLTAHQIVSMSCWSNGQQSTAHKFVRAKTNVTSLRRRALSVGERRTSPRTREKCDHCQNARLASFGGCHCSPRSWVRRSIQHEIVGGPYVRV